MPTRLFSLPVLCMFFPTGCREDRFVGLRDTDETWLDGFIDPLTAGAIEGLGALVVDDDGGAFR